MTFLNKVIEIEPHLCKLPDIRGLGAGTIYRCKHGVTYWIEHDWCPYWSEYDEVLQHKTTCRVREDRTLFQMLCDFLRNNSV